MTEKSTVIQLAETCAIQCGTLKGKKRDEMAVAFWLGAWSALHAVGHRDAKWVGRVTTLLIATRGFSEVQGILSPPERRTGGCVMSALTFEPNGIPGYTTLEQFAKDEGCFVALYLTPVRDVSTDPEQGTEIARCSAREATMWSIFGLRLDGVSLLIHDATVEDGGAALLNLGQRLGLPVGIEIDDVGRSGMVNVEHVVGLIDWLTFAIHDDLGGYDDPKDFQMDDFYSHPLAPLRKNLIDANGGTY